MPILKPRYPDNVTLSGAQKAHCEALSQAIQRVMRQKNGEITFFEYMDLVLYSRPNGYYCANSPKFGEGGDFITSPEVSGLFAASLANQLAQGLRVIDDPEVLEVGAGSGAMARDILLALEAMQCLPVRYTICETSPFLQRQQQQLLEQALPHLFDRLTWVEQLPTQQFKGVIVANELFDALPVHRVLLKKETSFEFSVGCGTTCFDWRMKPLDLPFEQNSNDYLQAEVESVRKKIDDEALKGGYVTEINLIAREMIEKFSSLLTDGLVLIVDYGYPETEFYHPQRNEGTLMCHFRHQAYDDPLMMPGLQDITSHVNFTGLAELAVDQGFHVAGYTTQALFLMACGITQQLEALQVPSEKDYLIASQKIKTLLMPNKMGEVFKVLLLTKNFDDSPLGFIGCDQRFRL